MGYDQLAVTGEKIYVPETGCVDVYNALTGAFEYSMVTTGGTGSGDRATGIKIRTGARRVVDIDIAPHNRNNPINIDNNGWGQVVVAILSTESFDATEVDPDTVRIEEAPVAVRGHSGRRKAHANRDINHDGLLDLVMHVRRKMTGAERGRDQWTLTGETYDGMKIEGTDTVLYVPHKE